MACGSAWIEKTSFKERKIPRRGKSKCELLSHHQHIPIQTVTTLLQVAATGQIYIYLIFGIENGKCYEIDYVYLELHNFKLLSNCKQEIIFKLFEGTET